MKTALANWSNDSNGPWGWMNGLNMKAPSFSGIPVRLEGLDLDARLSAFWLEKWDLKILNMVANDCLSFIYIYIIIAYNINELLFSINIYCAMYEYHCLRILDNCYIVAYRSSKKKKSFWGLNMLYMLFDRTSDRRHQASFAQMMALIFLLSPIGF